MTRRDRNYDTVEHALNSIKDELNRPENYGPPAVRSAAAQDGLLKTLNGFAHGPIGELEALAAAAQAEAAAIVKEATTISEHFQARTAELAQRVKRFTDGCSASKRAMTDLRGHLKELDGQPDALPSPIAPAA